MIKKSLLSFSLLLPICFTYSMENFPPIITQEEINNIAKIAMLKGLEGSYHIRLKEITASRGTITLEKDGSTILSINIDENKTFIINDNKIQFKSLDETTLVVTINNQEHTIKLDGCSLIFNNEYRLSAIPHKPATFNETYFRNTIENEKELDIELVFSKINSN